MEEVPLGDISIKDPKVVILLRVQVYYTNYARLKASLWQEEARQLEMWWSCGIESLHVAN